MCTLLWKNVLIQWRPDPRSTFEHMARLPDREETLKCPACCHSVPVAPLNALTLKGFVDEILPSKDISHWMDLVVQVLLPTIADSALDVAGDEEQEKEQKKQVQGLMWCPECKEKVDSCQAAARHMKQCPLVPVACPECGFTTTWERETEYPLTAHWSSGTCSKTAPCSVCGDTVPIRHWCLHWTQHQRQCLEALKYSASWLLRVLEVPGSIRGCVLPDDKPEVKELQGALANVLTSLGMEVLTEQTGSWRADVHLRCQAVLAMVQELETQGPTWLFAEVVAQLERVTHKFRHAQRQHARSEIAKLEQQLSTAQKWASQVNLRVNDV
jgi:hypothetical protein